MNLLRFALIPCLLAAFPAHCEEAVVAIGKQRAAASPIHWEVRELNHPRMGPIKVAMPTGSIVTPAGNQRVASLAFVSCEKNTRKIAIELANASSPDDPGGLRPKAMPRLICNSPSPKGDMTLVRNELATSWLVNDLGDALARGFSPNALRRCATIDVVQDVTLPAGWGKDSARIELEITPYGKDLDQVFAACGESTVYAAAPSSPPPPASPPPASPPPASLPSSALPASSPAVSRPPATSPAPPPTPAAGAPWKQARTTPRGRTNIRAAPNLDSAVVTMLAPGEGVLVQWNGTEWWKVKPRTGNAYQGYIRQDRLVFN
jgi:hypothetical protein